MLIPAGNVFPMFKISSPQDISFYDEHQKLIKKNGFVWFCRFGKTKISLKTNEGLKIFFVKESASHRDKNKKYLLQFTEISTEPVTSGYPAYYNSVDKKAILWMKVTSIIELQQDFENYFQSASSDVPLQKIYRSMCTSFFIKAKADLTI